MDKLFLQHSISEISAKTHISPIILEKLKNEEFSKISKIKINGFIKILEEEYPEHDFSKLKAKVVSYFDTSKAEIADIANNTAEEKKSNKKIYIIVFILLIGIIALMFLNLKNNKVVSEVNNSSQKTVVIDKKDVNNSINENNTTSEKDIEKATNLDTQAIDNKIEQEVNEVNNTTNISIETNNTDNNVNKEENLTLVVIPLKQVWFKVTYLDNFKSKEYLTSHEVDLNGSRPLFIKFGHGFITLKYNNETLNPNTKKITRIILKDKELNITKKRIREFE